MKKIQKVFVGLGIGGDLVEKIEVGFANDVYSVDDEYIFKIAHEGQYNDFVRTDI